ncbi:uncharacterized protein LOC142358750 isoform X3 [Convolutriloba macropyga]|uniref:uncharacterized protein LOC142358750 isoform X3 n=1 Tax=Convolutriloba macropyga TaxID=536237 RepID=UPI003F5287FD
MMQPLPLRRRKKLLLKQMTSPSSSLNLITPSPTGGLYGLGASSGTTPVGSALSAPGSSHLMNNSSSPEMALSLYPGAMVGSSPPSGVSSLGLAGGSMGMGLNSPSGAAAAAAAAGIKNPQMCGECGKVFTSSSALAKHKLTHSDERRYSCNLCHKRFKRQDHLNGHKLTHSATKPFVCHEPECGKSYCDQRQLKRHLANQHGKLEVDYAQLRKSKLFSPSNTTLVTIQGVNGNETQMYAIATTDENPTVEKESTCPVCHKTFPTLPALNGHMRLHGGYDKEGKEQAFREKAMKTTSDLTSVPLPLTINSGSSLSGSPPPISAVSSGLGSNSSSNVSSPAQPLALTVPSKQVTSGGAAPSESSSLSQSPIPTQIQPPILTGSAQSQVPRFLEQHDLAATNPLVMSALRDAIVSQSISNLSSSIAHINVPPSSDEDATPLQNTIPQCFVTPPPGIPTQSSSPIMDLALTTAPEYGGLTATESYTGVNDLSPQKFFNPAVFSSSIEKVVGCNVVRNNEKSSVIHEDFLNESSLHVIQSDLRSKSPQDYELSKRSASHITPEVQNLAYASRETDDRHHSSNLSAIGEQFGGVRYDTLKPQFPTQSALKSPFTVKSPGPSKSVHFVFPPPSNASLRQKATENRPRADVSMQLSESSQKVTCEIEQSNYHIDRKAAGLYSNHPIYAENKDSLVHKYERVPPPPPYDAAVQNEAFASKTPSAIPRHMDSFRSDTTCSRNRSYSVDERALRPKPDLDEFLTDLDEFIQNEMRKMDRRRKTIGDAARFSSSTCAAGPSFRSAAELDRVNSNSSSRHESPNISPTEKEVVSRLASNIGEEAAEISFVDQDEFDDDDDDAFLPPEAPVVTSQMNYDINRTPIASSAVGSSKSKLSKPSPLTIPSSVSNFKKQPPHQQAFSSGGNNYRADYYPHCFSASFVVDNNSSRFKFPKSGNWEPSTPSHATTGLLTPDRLDELFPDEEPVLRRNSVATFPVEECVTCSNEVPVTTLTTPCQNLNSQPGNINSSSTKVISSSSNRTSAVDQLGNSSNNAASGRRHSTSEVSPSKVSNNLSPPGVFKIPGSIAPSVMTAQPVVSMMRHMSSVEGSADERKAVAVTGPPSNMRRSFKPKPIHIPKHISTGVFRSCLKSPRPSVGMEPPPYTPPPMLTPKRLGPGLFTGSFPNVPFENRQLKRSDRSGSFSADIANLNEPELEPKINVGSPFQADLPTCIKDEETREQLEDKATLAWAPIFDSSLNDLEIDQYLSAANSCCLNGGGGNTELAFHALAKAGGSVKHAMKQLLARRQKVYLGDPLGDYRYQNCAYWSRQERDTFNQCWSTYGKDFYKMRKQLPAKSLSDIVEYYYSWKLDDRRNRQKPPVIVTKKTMSISPAKNETIPSSEPSPLVGGSKLETQAPASCYSKLQKRRKMSCQFDNCFAEFDSARAFNDHLITVHGANPSPVTPGPVTQAAAPVVKESENKSPRLTSDINKSAVESKREVPKSVNNNLYSYEKNAPMASIKTSSDNSNANAKQSTDESYLELSPASNGHFPCEICGKVFSKVKSRNAHMKMHRHQQQQNSDIYPNQHSMRPPSFGNLLANEIQMYNIANANTMGVHLVDPVTPPPLGQPRTPAFSYPKINSHSSAGLVSLANRYPESTYLTPNQTYQHGLSYSSSPDYSNGPIVPGMDGSPVDPYTGRPVSAIPSGMGQFPDVIPQGSTGHPESNQSFAGTAGSPYDGIELTMNGSSNLVPPHVLSSYSGYPSLQASYASSVAAAAANQQQQQTDHRLQMSQGPSLAHLSSASAQSAGFFDTYQIHSSIFQR